MRGTLSIIGAGRVGRALGRCLRERGWKIGAVVTCSLASARRAVRFIGDGVPVAGISARAMLSAVILIATPDDRIALVSDQLATLGGDELRGRTVLHTSGALDATVLQKLKALGASVGSIHPLQTFNGVRVPPLDGKLFAIEGDPVALHVARQIVRSLHGAPIKINRAKKPLYHAAAALAAGHILAVEESATRLLMTAGMNRRQAVKALLPLTRQVLDNFERLGPRAAWTGPLSRGDYQVIAAHINALRNLPAEFSQAYQELNRLASRVLADNPRSMQAKLKKLEFQTNEQVTGGLA